MVSLRHKVPVVDGSMDDLMPGLFEARRPHLVEGIVVPYADVLLSYALRVDIGPSGVNVRLRLFLIGLFWAPWFLGRRSISVLPRLLLFQFEGRLCHWSSCPRADVPAGCVFGAYPTSSRWATVGSLEQDQPLTPRSFGRG